MSTPPTPQLVEGTRYDFGEPPTVGVTPIPVQGANGSPIVYRVEGKKSAAEVHPSVMCQTGGTFYYEVPKGTGSATEWKSITVRGGMMASASALASFGTSVNIYNI